MLDIARIQGEVKAAGADGWLLYDFHNRDAIAYHVLGMDYGKFTSRRWFYWIPVAGDPIRLCHKVEAHKLDALPGEKRLYLSWRELHASLKEILGSARKVAMQYSPNNAIPYIGLVDAGTINNTATGDSDEVTPVTGSDSVNVTENVVLAVVKDFADNTGLAEAFEQFKLSILRHKTEGWQHTSPEEVLRCLDALKRLATAPSEESTAS